MQQCILKCTWFIVTTMLKLLIYALLVICGIRNVCAPNREDAERAPVDDYAASTIITWRWRPVSSLFKILL